MEEEPTDRCSDNVGSVASICGACLFSRGPVARPPIKAARDIGVPAVGGEEKGGGRFCNVSARSRLVSVLGPSLSSVGEGKPVDTN